MLRDEVPRRSFTPSLARKAGGIMLIVTSVVVACFLILGGVLLALSPGQPKPFLDANGRPLPGSLSEKTFVTINGVSQGMFITSKDVTHPVLLYLHGGMPDFFLTDRYPTHLEDDFTVVWWEQRGAGLSYNPEVPPETLTTEQAIADTLAVTNYLRQRFHQDKIYLMGHSGGTFIAIQAAQRAPGLYHAYIGVAQMSNQLREHDPDDNNYNYNPTSTHPLSGSESPGDARRQSDRRDNTGLTGLSASSVVSRRTSHVQKGRRP